jgi:hypothetical protein
MYLLLEDFDENFLTQETAIDLTNTIIIGPIFVVNYTLATNYNAYTFDTATITSGKTVTIPATSTWYIGFVEPETNDKFLLDLGPGYDGSSIHEHSLTEWTDAWQRERSPGDPLPDLFTPLVNR